MFGSSCQPRPRAEAERVGSSRSFGGLTIVNAGSLCHDHEPGFLIIDFDSQQIQWLAIGKDQNVRLAEKEACATATAAGATKGKLGLLNQLSTLFNAIATKVAESA